jgi:hypothetical protein
MSTKGIASRRQKKRATKDHVVGARFTDAELGLLLLACGQTDEKLATFVAHAALDEARRIFGSLTYEKQCDGFDYVLKRLGGVR